MKSFGDNSLAVNLLRYYLRPETRNTHPNTKYNNNDSYYEISGNQLNRLKNMGEIYQRLSNEYRDVFLSRRKMPKTKKFVGISPRLAGNRDPEKDNNGNYPMTYTGEYVEIFSTQATLGIVNKLKRHLPITYGEENNLDFYFSLHKHGLTANVTVQATPHEITIKGQTADQFISFPKWSIRFIKWENIVYDTYDFNKNVGIWLPNPDFGINESYAIYPQKEFLEFWELRHNYLAIDFVQKGWASPFEVQGTWIETREEIMGGAIIDISDFL